MSGRNRNYDKLAAAADQNVKEKEFWLKRLAGEPVKSCFPYDKRNKAAHERPMETMKLDFSGAVMSRLMELSKGSDVKLHMVLTAVLAVLLEKYTGNNDIILGAPIYKQDVEIEFINTMLIMRFLVVENMTFKDLLLQVKQVIIEAVENQNYPLEILLEQLGISYHEDDDFPLSDTVVLHENIHHKSYLEYIRCNVLFIFNGTGDQFQGVIEYNSALFEKTSLERISSHFQRLLAELIFKVDMPLSGMDMMSEAEKKQVISDFNDTEPGVQINYIIHELFEQQAAKAPDRIAAIGEEFFRVLQLSYRELNERANQLGRLLRDKGIKPGAMVGLMVEKSLELLVGIWGILKAGAAYLPIDLTYPRERIEYILKESGAGVLLTYTAAVLPVKIEAIAGLETINILSPGIYQGDASNLDKLNRGDDAAYIIYTSGSTGKPKGIIVEHRNVTAYLHAFYREFEVGGRDTALQQASYSFDVFVEEVYPVLGRGGKVVICPKYVILDMGAFFRFILKHDITFISVSPLLLNEIDKLAHTGSIRIFISGGDVLKKDYIENLVKKENVAVYNTYGPTETTVCATYYKCIPGGGENLPIGKPITNYSIYIMDRYDRVLPIGVPGELWITGPGVTRGYLNNPELTSDRFNRSYRDNKSYIFYKTGDFGRWLPDGNIEFIGRIDQQLKIRGFRIETGEIENCLLKYKGIKAALVQVKKEEILCAYIASEKESIVMELKEYLTRHLPDYMVPSHYVILDRLPLTAHGKPDMKALDAYKFQTGAGVEYIAPGTDLEIILSDIWRELLNLDKISIHDNFFDLGGNSMLLLKATNKIKEKLSQEVPYVAMFQYTTIHTLAQHIKNVGTPGDAGNASDNSNADKYEAQAETLEKGKDRMKKFINKTKVAGNG